jgi:hypothetical protein
MWGKAWGKACGRAWARGVGGRARTAARDSPFPRPLHALALFPGDGRGEHVRVEQQCGHHAEHRVLAQALVQASPAVPAAATAAAAAAAAAAGGCSRSWGGWQRQHGAARRRRRDSPAQQARGPGSAAEEGCGTSWQRAVAARAAERRLGGGKGEPASSPPPRRRGQRRPQRHLRQGKLPVCRTMCCCGGARGRPPHFYSRLVGGPAAPLVPARVHWCHRSPPCQPQPSAFPYRLTISHPYTPGTPALPCHNRVKCVLARPNAVDWAIEATRAWA